MTLREELHQMASDQQISVRTDAREGARVVYVAGEIDLVTTPELERAFTGLEHLAEQSVSLVVDLTEVSFLASVGLSALVGLNQRCSDAGVELRIAAGNRTVMRALTMSGLTNELSVDETLVDALGRHQL